MFTGFTTAGSDLLRDLAAHNDRDWFGAHRAEYDELVRGPMEELLAETEPHYGPGHVTRAHRDLRFSADKTPYKVDVRMWAGRVGCVYLMIDAHGLEVGGGLEPTSEQLARARSAIDATPAAGDELARALDRLAADGFEVSQPELARAPRGFDAAGPHLDLLRRKRYTAVHHLPTDAAPAEIRATWKRTEPLIEWAAARVGAS